MTETTTPDQGPDDGEVARTCTSCEEALDQAEIDDPLGGKDSAHLCDDCYRELYQYECCWCEEDDDNEHQAAVLVVFDPAAMLIALPGLYRIDCTSYYSQPLIGPGRLWEDALTWLGYLPACHADGYPCGYLCRRCQRKALADCVYATRCGAMAVLDA